MGTTTIRLTDALKARVAAAAKQEGTSAHNFIVEAIAGKVDLAARRADFCTEADRRRADFLRIRDGGTNDAKRVLGAIPEIRSAFVVVQAYLFAGSGNPHP